MIDTNDPLERLRAANPVPPTEVVLVRPDRVLFDRITSTPLAPVAARLHRRRTRRLVPALVVTSLLSGAVAYALLRGEVSNPETVACFETADLTSATDVAVVGAAGPIDACAGLWRRGVFGAGREVPPLVACVLPAGVAGVFPAIAGADVCTSLNLVPITPTQPPALPTTVPGPAPAPPPAPAADLNTRIVNFRDAVLGQFIDAPCLAPATAEDIVRRALDREGLGDWTILSTGYTAERPCATLSLRPEQRQVVLVPGTPRR
jgi:hypothetical protein